MIDHARGVEGPNAEINAKIAAARRKFEKDTRLALIERSVRYNFAGWCDVFELLSTRPFFQLTKVEYLDASNSWIEIPNDDTVYYFEPSNVNDYPPRPAMLSRLNGVSYPQLSNEQYRHRVRIEGNAGYGAASTDVPELAKHGMLTLIQHWFENREAAVVGTIATEIPLSYQAIVDDLHGEYYP